MQQIERREVVDAADVIVPVTAAAEQDAGVVAGRRLAHLHIKSVGVQNNFAAYGWSTLIGSQIVLIVGEVEGRGQGFELALRVCDAYSELGISVTLTRPGCGRPGCAISLYRSDSATRRRKQRASTPASPIRSWSPSIGARSASMTPRPNQERRSDETRSRIGSCHAGASGSRAAGVR
jgi:hypothetical protein